MPSTAPTVHLVVTAAAIGLCATGCGSSSSNSSTPKPASTKTAAAAATSSSPSPAAGTIYKAPDDICSRVDDQALTPVLGPELDVRDRPASKTGVLTTVLCNHAYGTSGARITALTQFYLANNGESLESFYQGLRGADASHSKVTDVPGLGQGAYAWTDPETGPHLAAYDGNLYLTLTILAGRKTPPPEVGSAMITSLRSTMTKLRQA